MAKEVDVRSRGEVVSHLLARHQAGQVKDCAKLRLSELPAAAGYLPKCEINWAKREPDRTVDALLAVGWDSRQIEWPLCPQDCPHYERAQNFAVSAGRTEGDQKRTVKAQPGTAAPLEPKLLRPNTYTLRWLADNVDVRGWLAIAGIAVSLLAAAFYAGMYVQRLITSGAVDGFLRAAEPTTTGAAARDVPRSPDAAPLSASKVPPK